MKAIQTEKDTLKCCVGPWGPASDRGHTVTECISSHSISCLSFLSGWLLRGRLNTYRLLQAQARFPLFDPGQIEIGRLKVRSSHCCTELKLYIPLANGETKGIK